MTSSPTLIERAAEAIGEIDLRDFPQLHDAPSHVLTDIARRYLARPENRRESENAKQWRAMARAALSIPESGEDAVKAERERIIDELRTHRCSHDGGFDMEMGPVGCDLLGRGETCVCLALFNIVSARGAEQKGEGEGE